MYAYAAIFLVASGIAALGYQVAWVRLLGLSMGSTSASISTVLAAFFLGMAIGSYLAERITRNRINSFSVYAALEAMIGLSGLVLLPILLNLDSWLAGFPEAAQSLGVRFFITLALLSVPTICMGATFPVMAAILVRSEADVGPRISQLYSLNTLGAAAGAVLAGFVFIPQWGLNGAITVAVTLNIFIAVSAWYLNQYITLPALEHTAASPENDAPASKRYPKLALLVLFVTGFSSIGSEVGWTKYLSIFTGTTIYGFAAILGVFLCGITAGAWYIRKRVDGIQNPARWLGFGLMLVAMLLVLTQAGLAMVPPVFEGISAMQIDGDIKQLLKYAFSFMLLFPVTFVFGALFPVNIRLYCGNLDGVRAKVGKAYAVNTIASIGGSITAGFWIIPTWGTDILLSLMALLVLLAGISFIIAEPSNRTRLQLGATATGFLLLLWLAPQIDYQRLVESVHYKYDYAAGKNPPEFLYLKEGKVSVISLVSEDGEHAKVQANGLNESAFHMTDASQSLVIESLLAYMPYFLHPEPKNAFVVGYGGGITTRAFTHTDIENIQVVELEEEVVKAGKTLPMGPAAALDDPRVALEINDARFHLLTHDQQYDIIAAQASHPWLARASTVFTQEFFELARSRLTPSGIFTQWVNLFKMDATTLRAIFKAFYSVFPQGFMMHNLDTGDYMLVGSQQVLQIDFTQINQRMQRPMIKTTLAQHEVFNADHLMWYFALSRDEGMRAAADIEANSDLNILSEVRLSAMQDEPGPTENPYQFLRQQFKFDLLPFTAHNRNLKRHLWDIGLFYLYWNSPVGANRLAEQLSSLDPAWGQSLIHHRLWWQFNLSEATELYESGDSWPDHMHMTQARIYLRRNQAGKARQSVTRISDTRTRENAAAMLNYLSGGATRQGRPDDQYWQLMLLSREDLQTAGRRLLPLISTEETELATLATALAYASRYQDQAAVSNWAHRLKRMIDAKTERYTTLFNFALNDNNLDWARALIDEISRIDPEHKSIHSLEIRLAEAKSG